MNGMNVEFSESDFVAPETQEEPKRRGRPPGSKNRESGEIVDFPEDAPKRRGRPPGRSKYDTSGIESILISTHAILASVVEVPEIAIDKNEAAMLSNATVRFCEANGIKISGKTGATLGLIYAVGAIWGPRGFMLYMRQKMKRNQGDGGNAPAAV